MLGTSEAQFLHLQVSYGTLYGLNVFGIHCGTRVALGNRLLKPATLLLASGCLSRLSLYFLVAMTTQILTWGKPFSTWISTSKMCMYLGPRVLACVTKEEFSLSHEVSHWHLGTGGQKMQECMFWVFFLSSFGACSCRLIPENVLSLLHSIPQFYWETVWSRRESCASELDTLELDLISATVSQWDLGYEFKYFDFFKGVRTMVRAWLMQL